MNFRDEDGDMLSMQDEGDFEAAVDVARYVLILLLRVRGARWLMSRVMSQGRAEGKLEIWVE